MNRMADHFMTWFVGLFLLVAGGIGLIAFKPLIATWIYEPVSGVIVQSKMEYCGMELSGYSEEIRFAYTVGDYAAAKRNRTATRSQKQKVS